MERRLFHLHWGDILDILEPDALDAWTEGDDEEVASSMAAFLRNSPHEVFFTHLDDPDAAGHGCCFAPGDLSYVEQIEQTDALVGQILEGLLERPGLPDEDWLIILSSDHGGEGTSHGDAPAWPDVANRIPLIVAGAALPSRGLITRVRPSHLDIHPTVMAFLGVPAEPSWEMDGLAVGGYVEESCGDGLDDDGDGATDCDDSDCAGTFLCGGCPELEAGSATGSAIASGTTTGAANALAGSCGGDTAPERTIRWASTDGPRARAPHPAAAAGRISSTSPACRVWSPGLEGSVSGLWRTRSRTVGCNV